MLDQGNSYFDIKNRLIERFKSSKVDEKISALLQSAFDEAVKFENIVLTRDEQKRLKTQITTEFLDDLSKLLRGGQ
ncbi:MAG TPA: hypothetical protein PKJ84_11905 [Anaerolineales bacterium]|nr:hypothetical protein [Anaerolineales bacterium]